MKTFCRTFIIYIIFFPINLFGFPYEIGFVITDNNSNYLKNIPVKIFYDNGNFVLLGNTDDRSGTWSGGWNPVDMNFRVDLDWSNWDPNLQGCD